MSLSGALEAFRGRRGERGLPAGSRWLPAAVLGLAAERRRAKGYYDRRTLALYRATWLRSRSLRALVDYALFRRDLGFPLTQRWTAPLQSAVAQLGTRRQRLASTLMAEIAAEQGALEPQPGDAATPGGVPLLHAMQETWRAAFADLVRRCAVDGICVVGNSGTLAGSCLGAAIDSHRLVVRFNRFAGAGSNQADIGTRGDVWVVAPGFPGAPPPGVRWIVVSGPDMRFRRKNWDSLRPALDAGAAVLTVPLAPWRALVARLQAPPSAGLLFLAWLRSMLETWEGVRAVGFGVAASSAVPYHHADARHKATGRHNWEGERALLRAWRDEGLAIELAH